MALSHSFLMHFQCGFGDEIVPLHPLLTIPLDFHLVAIKVRFDFTPVPFTQKKPYTKLIELNGFENITSQKKMQLFYKVISCSIIYLKKK